MNNVLNNLNHVWDWLNANGASHVTVILGVVTGLNVLLTWWMAKAIARQTRAMIQPVVNLEFHWKNEEKYNPESYFEIKNLGSQPLLVIDVKLYCGLDGGRWHYTDHQTLWDEHIIPPGGSLCPRFNFNRIFERDKLSWSLERLSYSLEVVVADLSKSIKLTYFNLPILSIVNVHKGMSLSVRWRYFLKPFKRHYYRIYYKFKKPHCPL
ncbi:MAG: hypothetical protein ABR906_04025 [Terracidiphilus sp.]|jgi:hypothetical protein